MKVLLALLAVVIIGYVGWRWYATRSEQQVVVVHPRPQQTAAKPTVSPSPSPTPARPVVVRRLAPEGVYFLLQRSSLTTKSGVIGFAPGTKVTLIEQSDSVSRVTDGQYEFSVPPSQLTNDLDIAQRVATSDYTAQARIAESIAQSIREYEQQQRDAAAATEKGQTQKKSGQRSTPRPTPKR